MTNAKTILFVALFVIAACEEQSEKPADSAPAAQPTTTTTAAPSEDSTEKGTKHDPPIALDKVPEGHWYCDMGTAHYSRATEGDGKCPRCGMNLKQMKHGEMGHEHGSPSGDHGGDDHQH